ncbi:MAG TPA: hypothetical protein PLX39_13140 [Pyrinomonadaceae bacterium]|nr:hypothetical protein [Pyrinomonadaceae bacterium]
MVFPEGKTLAFHPALATGDYLDTILADLFPISETFFSIVSIHQIASAFPDFCADSGFCANLNLLEKT